MNKRNRIIGALGLCAALLVTTPAEAQESRRGRRATFERRGTVSAFFDGQRSLRGQRGRHAARSVWIPGRFENRSRQIWIPARERQVYVEPIFEIRTRSCGTTFKVQVGGGYYETVVDPGYYETRVERVWVPGRYETRSHHRRGNRRGARTTTVCF